MWPFELGSFSLNIMPLRSITVVQSINSLLPFIAEQYSTVWMYHSFLTHHLLEDILVKVGSVTNKNVKKICVQIKKINWSPNLIIPKAYTISVCVCVCVSSRVCERERGDRSEAAAGMSAARCSYTYINPVDPINIMSNECVGVKRLRLSSDSRALHRNWYKRGGGGREDDDPSFVFGIGLTVVV